MLVLQFLPPFTLQDSNCFYFCRIVTFRKVMIHVVLYTKDNSVFSWFYASFQVKCTINFPWQSQGEAKPPGSQRSQPLSSPAPREIGLWCMRWHDTCPMHIQSTLPCKCHKEFAKYPAVWNTFQCPYCMAYLVMPRGYVVTALIVFAPLGIALAHSASIHSTCMPTQVQLCHVKSLDLAKFSTCVFADIHNCIKLNLGSSWSAIKPQKAWQN